MMKRLLALLLSSVVMAGMSASAFAAPPTVTSADVTASGDTNFAGDGTMMPTHISVSLPTTTPFAINPYQMEDATGSHIYSPNLPILNKSDVAVKVSVKASVGKGTASPAPTILVKDRIADVHVDGSVPDKEVYVELVAAKTATTVGASYANFKLPDAVNADANGADTIGKATLPETTTDANKAGVSFVLAAATCNPTTGAFVSEAPSNAGRAAYRFMGAVNPGATWTDNDLKITGVYTITPIGEASRTSQLNAASAELKAAAQNMTGTTAGTSRAAGAYLKSFTEGSALSIDIVKYNGAVTYTGIAEITTDNAGYAGTNLNNTRYFLGEWGTEQVTTYTATSTLARALAAGDKLTVKLKKADGSTVTVSPDITLG